MKKIKLVVIQCFVILTSILVIQNIASAQSCCQDIRGNVNNDLGDNIDISDLVYLVAFMFQGGSAPVCIEEADVNATGEIDISDLVYLVSYMFQGGETPQVCSGTNSLLFNDEFAGLAGQSPDPTKWGYDIGTNWGNNQLEYDTDRPTNVSLDGNGNLAIIALEESYMGQPYTSARIVTRDLFEPTYGRVEARIKLPVGQGIWPAFWLLGEDIETVGWPQCGEIDIMEYLGHETNKTYGTLHGPGYSAGSGISQSYVLESGQFNTDFHLFAIEWSQNEIRWYVDDSLYQTLTPDDVSPNEWVFDHPFYIILNVAVGGNWPGSPDASTVFPQIMLIDYVKVYESGDSLNTTPLVNAPTPTIGPNDVVSVFSDSYTSTDFSTWSSAWDDADVADFTIGTDNLKQYSNLVFSIAEYTGFTVDNSAMTHFHMDVWTPNVTSAPAEFKVKLVDYGANGVWDGGADDSEHEITLNENTMNTGSWVSIDLPLSEFIGLNNTGHFSQLILSGDLTTVFVDNIYFYSTSSNGTGATGATGGPYSVSFDSSLVSYLLSDFGGTFSTLVPDPVDASNTVAKTIKTSSAASWAGTTVDGVNITYPFSITDTKISVRVYSPDVGIPVRLKAETFGDPTRSVETEAYTTVANDWETLTFDFANEAPGTEALHLEYTFNLLSIFFNFGTDGATAGEKTYYWDTIEFTGGGGTTPSEPTISAPTPIHVSVDVVSLYSDEYADVTIDTWSADWDVADVSDFTIGSDNLKKYTNLSFAGIEFTSATIDASTMTHFHMDVWTPNPTAAPLVFKIKLVDFGANGVWDGGGDDVEHEITLDETTMNTDSWVSIELALADFTGLVTTGHLAQLIISGDPTTVYVDNIYFHK